MIQQPRFVALISQKVAARFDQPEDRVLLELIATRVITPAINGSPWTFMVVFRETHNLLFVIISLFLPRFLAMYLLIPSFVEKTQQILARQFAEANATNATLQKRVADAVAVQHAAEEVVVELRAQLEVLNQANSQLRQEMRLKEEKIRKNLERKLTDAKAENLQLRKDLNENEAATRDKEERIRKTLHAQVNNAIKAQKKAEGEQTTLKSEMAAIQLENKQLKHELEKARPILPAASPLPLNRGQMLAMGVCVNREQFISASAQVSFSKLGKSGAMNAPELLTINGFKYVCKRFDSGQMRSAQNFLHLFGVDFLGAFDNNIEAFAYDVISRNVTGFNIMNRLFSHRITIPMVKSFGVIGLHRNETTMPVLVMECIVGTTIKEWISDPNLRALTTSQFSSFIEQLVWIQIADFIIGQKDRHNDNVMIHFDSGSGSLRLTDIDNDVCLNEFGPVNLYIDGELVGYDRTPVVLPPLITPAMLDVIMNIDELSIAAIMNQGGAGCY